MGPEVEVEIGGVLVLLRSMIWVGAILDTHSFELAGSVLSNRVVCGHLSEPGGPVHSEFPVCVRALNRVEDLFCIPQYIARVIRIKCLQLDLCTKQRFSHDNGATCIF